MPAERGYARRIEAREIRQDGAELAFRRPHPWHLSNGEESAYANYIASYSKGLPHDAEGEVLPSAYRVLLTAVTTGDFADFERIPLGVVGQRKLTNPQSGLAYDLEGPDAQALMIPPAPRIDGPEASGEMGELYWMALARDVHFTAYGADPTIAAASTSLSNEFSDFRGPKAGGSVTPGTIFRGFTAGDLVGPYLSQFLLQPGPSGRIRYGSLRISQRQRTALAGTDFMTNFATWLTIQNGADPGLAIPQDSTRRFIRDLRDLAIYVRTDKAYQAYLNACLILLSLNPPPPTVAPRAMNGPVDPGNPYLASVNQEGFATFGDWHILTLLAEVTTRALKAVWFQKWYVHRRLRPEELGGRIEVHRNRIPGKYPMIDAEILNSTVVPLIEGPIGTALLPQAFPEGSPLHPAYGAGHATVAGACVTILKAYFDESTPIPGPVEVDPTSDGTALTPFAGPALTVGDELNKLAANISIGRNAAGVHWRSDYTESVKLGEAIAIGILEEQRRTYNEPHSFSLTKFDGTPITI